MNRLPKRGTDVVGVGEEAQKEVGITGRYACGDTIREDEVAVGDGVGLTGGVEIAGIQCPIVGGFVELDAVGGGKGPGGFGILFLEGDDPVGDGVGEGGIAPLEAARDGPAIGVLGDPLGVFGELFLGQIAMFERMTGRKEQPAGSISPFEGLIGVPQAAVGGIGREAFVSGRHGQGIPTGENFAHGPGYEPAGPEAVEQFVYGIAGGEIGFPVEADTFARIGHQTERLAPGG